MREYKQEKRKQKKEGAACFAQPRSSPQNAHHGTEQKQDLCSLFLSVFLAQTPASRFTSSVFLLNVCARHAERNKTNSSLSVSLLSISLSQFPHPAAHGLPSQQAAAPPPMAAPSITSSTLTYLHRNAVPTPPLQSRTPPPAPAIASLMPGHGRRSPAPPRAPATSPRRRAHPVRDGSQLLAHVPQIGGGPLLDGALR